MLLDWKLFAFAAAFFAALTAIFGKVGVSEINSNLATLIRTLIILLISVIVVSVNHQWQLPETLSKKALLFLTLSGTATGLSWLCYYRALQLGPVSKVAPVDKLSVVLVIIFATLFLNEQLTWKVGLGGTLITAGATLLLL
ncbi:MAG: EamA family transporter [Bdellovibrionales bacterium]|nr:EamA family transporter [Bdellovibrionales bacterium]